MCGIKMKEILEVLFGLRLKVFLGKMMVVEWSKIIYAIWANKMQFCEGPFSKRAY